MLPSRIESEASRMGLQDDSPSAGPARRAPAVGTVPVDSLALVSDAAHDARAMDPKRSDHLRSLTATATRRSSETNRGWQESSRNLVVNAIQHTPGKRRRHCASRAGDDAIPEVADDVRA